jgi:uncharacterized protein (TIGR03067 family)
MLRVPLILIAIVVTATLPSHAGDDRDKENGKSDLERLQGTWEAVTAEHDGQDASEEDKGLRIIFRDDLCIAETNGKRSENLDDSVKLDQSASPKTIDHCVTFPGGYKLQLRGIYELNGDSLKICLNRSAQAKRPTEFTTRRNDGFVTVTFQRVAPDKDRP